MDATDLRALTETAADLRRALKSGDMASVEADGERLVTCSTRLTPRRALPALRENLEIVIVAIAVAMGFRTYFIQPFKIPTGSMQPTLYGIHLEKRAEPGFMDRIPMRFVKWLALGESYIEIRAKSAGILSESVMNDKDPSSFYYRIGAKLHKVPKEARLAFRPGQYVPRRALLWKGIKVAGDHVFVDKVRWNFCRPKRGSVIVFCTDNITTLPQKTHYIKRLVGLPGEKISIFPPDIRIDGKPCRTPEALRKIAAGENDYSGYQLATMGHEALLKRSSDSIRLSKKQYFALGDNTRNSRDGRYWGSVPQANLVGPAFSVYWPFSKRWGRIQ